MFKTKFPLGKTGKTELVDLFSQIDGDPSPFANFDKDDFRPMRAALSYVRKKENIDKLNNNNFNWKKEKDVLTFDKKVKLLQEYYEKNNCMWFYFFCFNKQFFCECLTFKVLLKHNYIFYLIKYFFHNIPP